VADRECGRRLGRNLATLADPRATISFDPIEDVAFLAVPNGKTWQAVYYDTPQSLRPKLGLANADGLAGAGFWAVGYERGLPDYTALIADFQAGRSMATEVIEPGPGGASPSVVSSPGGSLPASGVPSPVMP
jgi:hypothetical protein